MDTTFLAMVATAGSEQVYVKAPGLLVVGGVIMNDNTSVDVSGIENELIVFVALFTASVELIFADVLFSVLSCNAVIAQVPVPTMVTTFPATVATNKLELV